jgi:hypothetical protein
LQRIQKTKMGNFYKNNYTRAAVKANTPSPPSNMINKSICQYYLF